jgi:type I restriction enzyme M protein
MDRKAIERIFLVERLQPHLKHHSDNFDKALAHYKANIENDYNLNIPRYVDTFETEDSIDINAIAREPKTLEMEMKDTDIAFASFCKELNIDTPF